MTLWNNTTNRTRYRSTWVVCALLVLLALASSTQMFAQTSYSGSTAAGTQIGNTASVSYVDASSQPHTNQSAAVYTSVQQIDAFVLTPSTYTVSGVANQNVNIKYTLTNNSNGTDVVKLSIPGGYTANVSSAHLYPDNGSGTAPNLSGGTLEGNNVTLTQSGAGATSTFWLVMQLASTAVSDTKTIMVNAIDQPASITLPTGVTQPAAYNSLGSLNNGLSTVTVNIVTGAAMTVTKSFDATSGTTGQTLTVTLRYANTGLMTSGLTYITDNLTTNSNFTYVPNSAKWNGVTIADSNGTSTVGGVAATWNWDSTGKVLEASLNNVPPSGGSTYTFTYQVTVAPTAPGTYTNTAQYIYNDSVNWTPSGVTGTKDYCTTAGNCLTTSAQFTVNPIYTATLTPPTNTIASATSAQPILYAETATNTGNGSDALVLSIAATGNSFPAGTTFTYYTNANPTGAPAIGTALSVASGTAGQAGATYSTGTVAAGGTYNYVIAVQVPVGSSSATSVSFTASATPHNGAGTAATAVDTLTKINPPVDLTSARTDGTLPAGTGPGPETSVQVVNPTPGVIPQQAYTYELVITNNTSVADTYKLVASSTTGFGTSDSLPAGWTVGYYLPTGSDCTTLNSSQVSFPVNVANGASTLVCAVVNTPAQTAPATYPVYFQAFSTGSTGSKDGIYDALLINTYNKVSIAPAIGSVNAGAAVVLTNVITNNGNVPETITFASGFVSDTPTPSTGLFTSTLYQTYANGTVGGPITTGTQILNLPPGQTVNIYTQVAANSGDAIGNQDKTTITITYTGGTASADDITTVTGAGAAVTVTKQQALDASCNKSSLTFVTTPVQAKPGQCVVYQITATNGTGQAITNVLVSDTLSTYTTYCDGTGTTCGASEPKGDWTTLPGAMTSPGPGTLTSGTLASTALPTMNSGDTAVFTFAVQIK